MKPILLLLSLLASASSVWSAGPYHVVEYPPSKKPGELVYGVTYTVWIPEGVKTLRGVIVHQHGCGAGACKGGETAAYDLHWQALAKKWNCALLGPSYQQEDGQNCRLWCDPRNGSNQAFLNCLKDLAKASGHPELAEVPWCLWGHSGGGFWASLMQTLHPERIVAIWCQSGTAFTAWEKGEIPQPEIPESVYGIPVMLCPGAKEKGDKRFDGAWTGSLKMFHAYRAKGAPIALAPDPRTGHECGDSRYLAIPYFDACLALRLPASGTTLKPIDPKQGWLAPVLGEQAVPVAEYKEKLEEAVWLPSEAVALAWSQFVKTGATEDKTPPPAPTNLVLKNVAGGVELSWQAEADFESGIQQFIILKNGQEIGRVPEKPIGRFGRPLFQTMSYHDTPEKPLPQMKFVDKLRVPGDYSIVAVNSVGLRSDGK